MTTPLAVPESLRERIAKANQLDLELYGFATWMLDADRRRDSAAAGMNR
jgi:hypothetical protein